MRSLRPRCAVVAACWWVAASWGCMQLGDPKVANAVGCVSDDECKGDRVCRAGSCVAGISEALRQRIAAGDATTEALVAAAKTQPCTELPGLAVQLAALDADPARRKTFMAELAVAARTPGHPQHAYGAWLLALAQYGATCGGAAKGVDYAKLSRGSGALVTEAQVDEAVRGHECGRLMRFETMQLWPFKRRFTHEISQRKFETAEVTRRLWLDTLSKFKTECTKRLSRRQSMSLDAQLAKLERIVGLDDPTLVTLRTKLLTAMEAGNSGDILAYTRAVTEREMSLDTRNAAAYQSKLRDTEKQLEADRVRLAAAQREAADARQAAAVAAAAKGQQPAAAEPDVLDDAKKAIEAMDAARQLFDM